MKNQRLESFSQPKNYDFNSMILSGRPPSLNNHLITQQQYLSKLKQIKALKKFQDLFKRQYLKKENKYSISIQQTDKTQQSPHELSNRLKGMFFLRRKAELQYKYREESSGDEYQQDQPIKFYPPIQGKAVSPFVLRQRKQKQRYKQKQKKQKQKESKQFDKPIKTNQIKPLKFVNYHRNISGKVIQKSFTPIRPVTQLQGTQKIFNNQTLYSAIIAANKTKIMGMQQPSFSYFNVYVQEGNNSEMIKSAVRKRSCWKVVEMPSVAHMIWSQWYRKNLDIKVKIHKQTQKQQQKQIGQLKSLTIGNLTFLSESSIKKKKQQKQKNPNLMPIQQYNKQIQKICPRSENNRKPSLTVLINSNIYFYNHIPNNHNISDKTNLLRNMKRLYERRGQNIFQVMPFSIDITEPCQITDLQLKIQNIVESSGYWIIKPGQNSNRGKGITVCKGLQAATQQINSRFIVKNSQPQPTDTENTLPVAKQNIQEIKLRKQGQTVILQKYIEPLLYFKRKFDIRMYMLVTNVNSKIRGYVYSQGYVRTSSKIFSMETFNKFVHLTNDAIQSRSSDYGKFQEGNKVSWKNFQKWLEAQGYPRFWSQFTIQYKKICKNILESVKNSFTKKHSKRCSQNMLTFESKNSLFEKNNSTVDDQKGEERKIQKRQDRQTKMKQKIYYEIFGLDFLIDNKLKTWLIEVNTNPALTTDCSRVVNCLIPKMIDNAFAIAVQPYLKNSTNRYFDSVKFQNSFETIFDDQWNS